MARLSNKRYNYLAQSLTNLLAEVDEHLGPTWFAKQYPNAIRLVPQAHAIVQNRKIREKAKWLDDMDPIELFNDHMETPSYYGYGRRDADSIRGLTLGEATKAMCNIPEVGIHFWEDLGAMEYYMYLDRKRYIQSIAEHISYNTAPADLQLIEDPKGRDLESLEWGDETIMTADEWLRLEEFMDDNNICYNEQSDLIWHECSGFDVVSLIGIVDSIDEDHDRWNGYNDSDYNCILARLENIHDEQPLVAQLLAHKIEEVMSTTNMSFARRYKKCEGLLDSAELETV